MQTRKAKGGRSGRVTKSNKNDKAYLFSEQKGSYTVGNDSINFSSGKVEHKNIQLRGALPAMDAPTVYLTGFTPFQHILKLS